jgi:hypothetical protein
VRDGGGRDTGGAEVRGADPAATWDPFAVENIGTVLFQWGIVLLLLIAFNRTLVRRTRA